MKIGSPNPAPLTPSVSRVTEKQDKDQSSGRQQHDGQQENPRNKESREKIIVTEAAVEQAIEGFRSDALTQKNGLEATALGEGPGLRVLLKDATGVIIRNLSGEEFIELRDSVRKDGRKAGKILDQKL